MTKILTYSFEIEDAVLYGVEEAVVLYNLKFWLFKNMANQKHIYDNNVWTFNSVKAFTKLFPFWSEDKIRRLLNSMEDRKIIISGNYNKLKYDRTKWYSIPQICNFHSAELPNGSDESAEPIPDINAVLNSNENINKNPDINKEVVKTTSTPSKKNFKIVNNNTKSSNITSSEKINIIYNLFKEYNFETELWGNRKQNREAAITLYEKKGLEKVKNILKFYKNEFKGTTVIGNTYDLVNKYDIIKKEFTK